MTNPWLSKLRYASNEELARVANARDNLSGDTPIEAVLTAQHLQAEQAEKCDHQWGGILLWGAEWKCSRCGCAGIQRENSREVTAASPFRGPRGWPGGEVK